MKLRFGIKTAQQFTSYDDILRVWLEADAIPIIEHAWAFDHFIPLGPDPTGPQPMSAWTGEPGRLEYHASTEQEAVATWSSGPLNQRVEWGATKRLL